MQELISALGQKQTCARKSHVRFTPETDIGLARAEQHCLLKGETLLDTVIRRLAAAHGAISPVKVTR